jgi:transposase
MVMALSLLILSFAEWKLRETLSETKKIVFDYRGTTLASSLQKKALFA